jgi:hypothetical protein
VLASTTEVYNGLPHAGSAHFTVANITPYSGYAWVYIYSDWYYDLPVWINCHVAS